MGSQVAEPRRDVCEYLIEVIQVDRPGIQRGVQGGDGVVRMLASDYLHQSIPCAHGVLAAVRRINERPPMQLDTIARGRRERHSSRTGTAQTRRFPGQVNMCELCIEGEDTHLLSRRHARQTPAHPDGFDGVTIGCGEGVMVAPNTEEEPRANRLRDGVSRHTGGEEFVTGDYAARSEIQC